MKVLVFNCRKVLEINCRKLLVSTCFLQAVESGGNLSDETRKRMMKEAVHELRNNIQTVYDTERS